MKSRLAALLLAAAPALAQYEESITVSRVLIEVRVTQANGEAIADLTPADFEVTIGGTIVTVASATFVRDDAPMPPSTPSDKIPYLDRSGEVMPVFESSGRLFVVFIQTDFTRHHTRTKGQMKFRRYAEEFVRSLAPEDRVAVFSFDSHLKFRCDFTTDKDAVADAIEESILIDQPPPPPPVFGPSLAPLVKRSALRRATTPEKALKLIGDALRPVDGAKTLFLIGWGLGHRTRAGTMTVMDFQWPSAFKALEAARVTLYALDTTEADSHDLQGGLKNAAETTGGYYASTFHFPHAVVDRLQRTISGHYELELLAPSNLGAGTHLIDVTVRRRGNLKILFPQMAVIEE